MQVTSPVPVPPEQSESPPLDSASEETKDKPAMSDTSSEKDMVIQQPDIVVSPASIEMLSKLFPNKKRAVLELVLKRCNHDLLKAIEHFNSKAGPHQQQQPVPSVQDVTSIDLRDQHSSAFKPVGNKNVKSLPPASHPSGATIPILASSKVFMHNFYPFLPLFNPQPVLQNPAVYVPGLCECDQCKHGLYARLEPRP